MPTLYMSQFTNTIFYNRLVTDDVIMEPDNLKDIKTLKPAD